MREIDLTNNGVNPSLGIPNPLEENGVEVIEEKPPLLSEIKTTLIGKPLKTVVPGGIISDDVIKRIRDLIFSGTEYVHRGPLPTDDPTGFQWVWQAKTGNFPKRLAKWFRRHKNYELSQDLLVRLGNLAKQGCDDGQEYFFEITNKIEWGSKEMGQAVNGSCWWSSSSSNGDLARYQQKSYCDKYLKEGGLAIKFFPNDTEREISQGIGRIWMTINPHPQDYAYLFNGYWCSQGATERLARVIATYLGLSYRAFTNNDNCRRFYVNSSKGYILAPAAMLDSIDWEIITIPRTEPMVVCQGGACPNPNIAESTAFTLVDRLGVRLIYCLACKEKMSFHCRHCHGTTHNSLKNDVVEITVEYYYKNEEEEEANRDRVKSKRLRRAVRLTPTHVLWCSSCIEYTSTCFCCESKFYLNNSRNLRALSMTQVDAPSELLTSFRVLVCPLCIKEVKRCQDCTKKTLNVDAMDVPTCVSCENLFESEINIEENERKDNLCVCIECRPDLYPHSLSVDSSSEYSSSSYNEEEMAF